MMSRFSPANLRAQLPGVMIAAVLALAATFVSEHYGGPQFLYALLFGMAFNFLAADAKVAPGINLSAKSILRIGVALLGAGITLEHIRSLGTAPLLLAMAGVFATIGFGVLAARVLKRSLPEGLLTGGAVAICGASAALAISAVLPKTADSQRQTLLTVVGVTTLSTIAMIAYPAIAHLLDLDSRTAGFFLGATIHDVAQVVGAGYMYSPEAGTTATYVKLFRVTLLVPVVVGMSLLFRMDASHDASGRPPLLPLFLVSFIVLAVLNSQGLLPAEVSAVLLKASRWCLVLAIAALGVKTSFGELRGLGWAPVVMLVAETVFLALFVLAGMWLLR